MDDMRLIDANDLLKHLTVTSITTESKKENMQYFISGIRQCMKELVIPTVQKAPTIDPKSLRPVAHWEEIPGSYRDHIGKDGSWFGPATRCTNPDCGEVNPCSLKTPFCPMCGFRMEDVPYDND